MGLCSDAVRAAGNVLSEFLPHNFFLIGAVRGRSAQYCTVTMLSKAVIAISALAVLAACGAVSVPKPSVVADGVVSVASFRSEGNPPFEPVGGDIWPVAIYWCFVGLGTPAVQFPVAIDSGSYTLDIPKMYVAQLPASAPQRAARGTRCTRPAVQLSCCRTRQMRLRRCGFLFLCA